MKQQTSASNASHSTIRATANPEIEAREQLLLQLTGNMCDEVLDNEYRQLSEKLIRALTVLPEVPYMRGKPEIWAAAVVYAIGTNNFLFDKSFEPFMTASDLCACFGTKQSTVSSKARLILDLLGITYYDRNFSTKFMLDQNPFNNLVMVDGFIVSLNTLPEDAQAMVKAARARGEDIEFRTRK